MMLQALAALAEREGLVDDPDYEFAPVAWLVRIDAAGSLIGVEGTHQDPGARRRLAVARKFRIPRRPTGKTGKDPKSAFLVENAKFVFGRKTEDVKPEKYKAQGWRQAAGRFSALLEDCRNRSGDEGIASVLLFLERVAAGEEPALPPKTAKSNELFAFLIGDGTQFVHERPAVQRYWRQVRAEEVAGNGPTRPCLVTGHPVAAPGLVPMIKRVPGGNTSGAGLVSFNESAYLSHGWSSNDNAPISREAAEAVSTALNRLLSDDLPDPRGGPGEKLPRRYLRLSADTAVVYWSASASSDFVDFLSDTLMVPDDPAKVPETYRSLWRGAASAVEDPGAFYAITLGGAQGRLIVRDWLETTVADVARSVSRHFDDFAVVRNARFKEREPPAVGVRQIIDSLTAPGTGETVSAGLVADVIRAALGGTRYPIGLLQRALLRARAEAGRDAWIDSVRRDARAAVVKAVLRRTCGLNVETSMDHTNIQPGYLLGRLMAVIERMQGAALGSVNATVVDRYFSGASASPSSVFPRLMKGLRHHASKAKDEEAARGTVRWLEGETDEIVSKLTGPFPAFLDLQQQGLFVIGYHHERHHLWQPRSARTNESALPSESA